MKFEYWWISILLFAVCNAHAAPVSLATDSRYVIQGDTVYDKVTNLTWQRCSVGQQWVVDTGCVGSVGRFTYDDARKLENKIWRLPTKDELESLIDQNRKAQGQKPMININAFPNMTEFDYWSSTNAASERSNIINHNPERFANVNFNVGNTFHIFRGAPFSVRLVKSGQ